MSAGKNRRMRAGLHAGMALALTLGTTTIAMANDSEALVQPPVAEARPLDAATLAALGIEQSSGGVASEANRPIAPQSGTWSWTPGAYSYDGSGNITAIGTESAYLYDVRGRLVDATMTRQSATEQRGYTYDAFGNRISMSVGSSPIATPTSSSTNHLTGLGAVYDAAGNVTQLQPPGQSTLYHYKYDALGALQELKAANVSQTPTQVYIYTAGDERLWTFDLAAGTSHWKIRDLGGKVLRDYYVPGTSWTLSRDYIYRDGQLLAAVTPTETLYFSLDHLGTPRVITGANRTRLGFHYYLPFGEEWTDQSGAQEGEPMKFTGHERDGDVVAGGDNELDYMHARYYDPNLGRFLSVDPDSWWTKQGGTDEEKRAFQFNLRRPQGWNRYSYVVNNPINRIDPDGRVDQNWDGGAAAQLFPDDRAAQLEFDQGVAEKTAIGSALTLAAIYGGPPVWRALGNAAVSVVNTVGRLAAAAEATRRVVGDPNRMSHIFRNPGHKLDGLVRAVGSQQGVVNAVARGVVAMGKISTNAHGVFSVTVKVNGQNVEVTGRVIRDVLYISNFWIR